MKKEYELEELADLAVKALREFIDTEQLSVQQEHAFHSKLASLDYIIGHLDERIPPNMEHLHGLNREIVDKLLDIREFIQSAGLHEISIVREEEHLLQQLEQDVARHEWRAVKKQIDSETSKEKGALRLEKAELKGLHSRFLGLMRLMKKSSIIKSIGQDITGSKDKEEYERLEEYYFLQIYKFVAAYEKILRHLLDKEVALAEKIKRVSRKIRPD